MTKTFFRRVPVLLLAAVLAGPLFLATACDHDDDDYDHTPAVGRGAIVVDNETFTDIEFYANGAFIGAISDYRDRAFDFKPGKIRVLLIEEDGDRRYSEDVDVLVDRLTVLRVRTTVNDFRRYDVSITYP